MTDENKNPNIHVGGNVSGANVNIGGTQSAGRDFIINTGTMPAASEDVRKQLEDLIAQLQAELAKVPAEQAEDAEAVKELTQKAVAEANEEKPDKDVLQIRGDKLMAAAKNLAAVAPTVLQIATTIVGTLLTLAK